jgi:ubiquinone/menaquinone biosynthesis C-methylase UbiE
VSTLEPAAGLSNIAPVTTEPVEDLDSRVEREKEFYNSKGQTSYHTLRMWIWRALGEFKRNDDQADFYDPAGKIVLDYGCGPGYLTNELLDRGAVHVTGIDISEGEIEEAHRRAVADGVADCASHLVADAHAMPFEDDAFDLIVGDSILHHLELEKALREIRRVLRPGGRAVFMEPLWHSPILRLGRALTPAARTPDEHPLTVADWELCARIFPDFEHHEREFLTIPLMPLNLVLPQQAQKRLARRVHRIDDRVLARYPRTRKYARITFLVLK